MSDTTISRIPTTSVDPSPATTDNLLTQLRAALSTQILPKPVILSVPSMEGVAVQYSHKITDDQLQDYAHRCGIDMTDRETLPTEDQNIRSTAMLLDDACMGIYLKDGDQYKLWLVDGEPVLFKHKPFFELVGTENHTEGIIKFYGVPGDVVSTGQAVLMNAGRMGTRVEKVDPTKGR